MEGRGAPGVYVPAVLERMRPWPRKGYFHHRALPGGTWPLSQSTEMLEIQTRHEERECPGPAVFANIFFPRMIINTLKQLQYEQREFSQSEK